MVDYAIGNKKDFRFQLISESENLFVDSEDNSHYHSCIYETIVFSICLITGMSKATNHTKKNRLN